jgi:hypothetical protein
MLYYHTSIKRFFLNKNKHMNTSKAFALTLEKFEIKASELSKRSGIDQQEISRFRNGHKDIVSQRLMMLIKAMPLHAQVYFWSLCMGKEDTFLVAC